MNAHVTADMPTSDVVLDFKIARTPNSAFGKQLLEEALARAEKGGGVKGAAEKRSDLFWINPYLIQVREGWNSREEDDPENKQHIDNLALSITENGVKEPLTVYRDGNQVVLTNGHCRLLATFRAIEVYGAQIMSVPVATEDPFASEADRILSQITRNGGKPLSTLETSTVYKKMFDLGWSETMIAKKAAVSPTRVRQLLEVNTLPEEIKALVRTGKVSVNLAITTFKAAENAQAALDALNNGVEVAASAGKKRATAKHIGKTTFKTQIKTFFQGSQIDDILEDREITLSEDQVAIVVPRDAIEKLRPLLKI